MSEKKLPNKSGWWWIETSKGPVPVATHLDEDTGQVWVSLPTEFCAYEDWYKPVEKITSRFLGEAIPPPEKEASNVLDVFENQLFAQCPLCDGCISAETPLAPPKLPTMNENTTLFAFVEDSRMRCPWCSSPLEVTVHFRER